MKTFKNIDFTLPLLGFIFMVAAITSLPFDSSRTDMSSAEKVTVNVDSFETVGETLYFAGKEVETDENVDLTALFEQKEEINIRVKDNNISIIYGDN